MQGKGQESVSRASFRRPNKLLTTVQAGTYSAGDAIVEARSAASLFAANAFLAGEHHFV